MRYIANSDGYLQEVSFGADITCGGTDCTEYTGAVPTGYTSLEEWYCQECEKLHRWKIVDGQLTLDANAAAPPEYSSFGTWTPTCPAFSSPTAAEGYYTKIGNMVTVSWFISGTSDSDATDSYSLAIYGLPFQPDTNVRWFGGGGNIANAETHANYAFSGYVIDHMAPNGSCIVPRTTATGTSRATRGTLYAMNSKGASIIMAGTLMYKCAE